MGEAILSAVSQNSNLQVIVVDDGSTDGSLEEIEKYASQVELLRTANQGIADARNRAIEKVQAPYTLLLDHDDRLAPGAVETLLLPMQNSQDRVTYGRFEGWDATMTRRLAVPALAGLAPDPMQYLSQGDFTPPGAILFPSSAFQRVGLLDQSVAGCDDWDFLVRLARSGYDFHGIDRVVFHYRRLATSASNRPQQMLAAGLEVIGRAHAPDDRVQQDRYPEGLAAEFMLAKQFLWGADCFALSAVRGQESEMEEVFCRIPQSEESCWYSFVLHIRQMLAWHCQPYGQRDTDPFGNGLFRAAQFLQQKLSTFEYGSKLWNALLYPGFSELLRRPGPRKAVRLIKEWRQGKSVSTRLLAELAARTSNDKSEIAC